MNAPAQLPFGWTPHPPTSKAGALQHDLLQSCDQVCSTDMAISGERLHGPALERPEAAGAVQIFPGGYYLCKPGQPRKNCLTLQPGRKLLQGRASADAPQTAMSMQQSTGAQTAAYMYFVMPGIAP